MLEADRATAVVLAVLTYRRPDDLTQLLPLLDQQRADVAAEGRWTVRLLVVDNDPQGSAEAICAGSGLAALRYVHEPVPGIAAARNRALSEAVVDDVLVFIDDDERPVPGWLRRMLTAFERTGRVGVVGPVVSRFTVPPHPWILAGRFFERRRHRSGALVQVAATNNLLLDLRRVRAAGVAFDPAFGLSGGSDTLFVRRLVRAEGPLVWCDEAAVTDVVPAARCRRGWVVRRAFRMGNSWSRVALALEESRAGRGRGRLALTAAGTARIAGGLLGLVAGWCTRDRAREAGGTRAALRGAGIVAGAWGYTYLEYRR